MSSRACSSRGKNCGGGRRRRRGQGGKEKEKGDKNDLSKADFT
jgi:hypothetical protein